MRTLTPYRSLGAIDVRTVARDSLLRWMVVLAPAFGLLCRFAVPPAAAALERRFQFNLVAYYPLVMSLVPLVAAAMLGTVVGFLLLDQRDDQTMKALLVTPLSLGEYLRYRIAGLALVSIACSCVALPLAGLTQTTPAQVLVVSTAAAPLAPIYALFLGSFAANKVQGFALAKAVGIVLVPCVVSYFVRGPWQIAFGLVPHYWPLKVFWLFDAGAGRAAVVYALAGFGWQAVVLVLLTRRFDGVLRR